MKALTWPDRLYTLDVSRGLAALSVVLWHWEHFTYRGTVKPADYNPKNQPLYEFLVPFYEKGASGVQYFFLLSGFVFFWLYRNKIRERIVSVREFVVQRFSRLYPLHLVTLLVVALLQGLYLSREQVPFVYGNNDLHHFLLQLGFASNWGLEHGLSFNGPTWSVSVEVLLYAVFFLAAFMGRGGPLFCVAVSMVASGLFLATDHGVFNGAAMFFLGGGIHHATAWIAAKASWLVRPVWALTALLWAGVLVHFYLVDLVAPISALGVPERILALGFQYYLLFPLTICGLALLGMVRADCGKRISWVGDITYSSYLIHFPMQLLCALAVSYAVIPREFYKSSAALIAFFAVLVPLSYLVYRKFEMPVQKAIRRSFSSAGKNSDRLAPPTGLRTEP